MRHIKTFESYSIEEVKNEKAGAECKCDCKNCKSDDCECKECNKSKEISEKKKNPFAKFNKDKKEKEDDKPAKGKKADKEDDKPAKGAKGLTAGQKKLPKAFQAAILKKQGKK